MASLKSLKNRIKSVKSTQKITKAMKMVAAAKLRRAKDAAEAARPYAEKMETMLGALASGVTASETAPALMVGTGNDHTHLLIVATGDRGLCGAFNSSIVRAARKRIRELQGAGKTVKIFCVGRKAYEQLSSEYGALIVRRVAELGKKKLGYADAQTVSRDVLSMFEAGEFDVASIVYNHFRSAISQVVTWQQLVPLSDQSRESRVEAKKLLDSTHSTLATPYEYEPGEQAILETLLPQNLAVQIYKALLENAASEQGARMSAMDNATRNAGDTIKKLTLVYNRTRQAGITKELIEIISGAEAV